jgi:hypothetical protein
MQRPPFAIFVLGLIVRSLPLHAAVAVPLSSTAPLEMAPSTSTLAPSTATHTSSAPAGDDISQGLWWLYQLDYERAHSLFAAHAKTYPDDPAGYFYEAATDWWQLAQEFDYKLPAIEARFETDYREAVAHGRQALKEADDNHQRALACLYWGGAEGLKGRWLVTQKDWVKAYFLGRRGNSLLHRALRYDPKMYDAYMGIGIYDYFTDTLSGVVKAFSALLIHGDRVRGIKELKKAIQHGQRARVESMIFLVEIYTSEENTASEALPLTHQLREEFPQSPAMHLAEIMVYYAMKQWDDVAREAQPFLEKSEKEEPYYKKTGIRPATYCLGMAAFVGRHDLKAAEGYFDQILTNIDTSRWVTFAYLRRAEIEDLRGQRTQALANYETVLNRQDFWGSHDEARRYKDKPFHSDEQKN